MGDISTAVPETTTFPLGAAGTDAAADAVNTVSIARDPGGITSVAGPALTVPPAALVISMPPPPPEPELPGPSLPAQPAPKKIVASKVTKPKTERVRTNLLGGTAQAFMGTYQCAERKIHGVNDC